MHFLAILLHGLLGFFPQGQAVRQVAIPLRRNDRRDAAQQASLQQTARTGRESGFGWMNVASLYESRREPPRWGEVPGVLDDQSTRRGG